MSAGPATPPAGRLPLLGLLLLVTYAVHIAEEYYGGFPAWASALTGLSLSEPVFLQLSATFFAVMTAGVVAGFVFEPARWLLIPLGTVVLINGTGHLAGSLLTWSYSPGVISGTLLWIPLGLLILRTARSRWTRPRVRAGVLLGVGLHLLVPLSAWLAARRP